MNIYIGNLAYSISDEELQDMFTEFGEVASATVIMDRQTGRSKGFGFIEMPNNSEADGAIKALNGKQISGRAIKVNQALPKGSKPQQQRRRF
ncbi:RNA-binding protein [Ectothiorhodospiraceae bacterium BW-2]|nr:RNA-binding protein [Ectothiorhodospiraceae bacterium BW-2]